jgi:hypothetical protein
MEGFSFVTPVTGLNRPNTLKEEEEEHDDDYDWFLYAAMLRSSKHVFLSTVL